MEKEEILIIDTASRKNCFAIFEGNKKLFEKIWESKAQESEDILKLLQEKNISPKKIVVVRGPGNFTSLRIGVVAANVLGYLYNAKIFGITVFDYWKERFKEKGIKDYCIIVSTNKGKVFADSGEGKKIFKKENLGINKNILIGGEMSEKDLEFFSEYKIAEEKSLLSRSEAILKASKNKKAQNQIKPLYLRGGGITKSKKL